MANARSLELVDVDLPGTPFNEVLGYLGDKVNGKKFNYDNKFTFFGNLTNLLSQQTIQAVSFVFRNDLQKVEALIEANRSILFIQLRAVVRGRIIDGTLLRFAAGARNAEMVNRISNFLSEEERVKQLTAQFPPGWEKKPEIQKKRQAVSEASKAMVRALKQSRSATVPELFIELKEDLDKFAKVLGPNPQEIITFGWHFDSWIFHMIEELLGDFISSLGVFSSKLSSRSDFAALLLGFVESLTTESDYQRIQHGLLRIYHGELPKEVKSDDSYLAQQKFQYLIDYCGKQCTQGGALFSSKQGFSWEGSRLGYYYKETCKRIENEIMSLIESPRPNRTCECVIL